MYFVLFFKIPECVPIDMQNLTFWTQLSCCEKNSFKNKMSNTKKNRSFHPCFTIYNTCFNIFNTISKTLHLLLYIYIYYFIYIYYLYLLLTNAIIHIVLPFKSNGPVKNIKRISESSRNFVLKTKQYLCSDSQTLRHWNPIHQQGP